MVVNRIKENKWKFDKGTQLFIPHPKELGVFTEVFPGRMKDDITCITGSSSSSKSSFTRYLVFEAIYWSLINDQKYCCLWFALEETETQLEYSLLAYLSHKFSEGNVRLNIENFLCMKPFPSDEEFVFLETIESLIYPLFRERLIIFDNIYNSYGIYAKVREYATELGKYYYKGTLITDTNWVKDSSKNNWDTYVSNSEDYFMEVVVDHAAEISPSSTEGTLQAAMEKLMEYVKKYITKAFGFSVIIVQQQALENENLDHIKEKQIYPTRQGLGDSKRIGRTYLNIIGITSPNTFGISVVDTFNGKYNVQALGNYCRVINIIKRRFGRVNDKFLLTHDGKCGYFEGVSSIRDTAEWQSIISSFTQ